MEAVLLRALEEVQTRSTVEECLKEMVLDVELAHQLEQQVSSREQLQYYKDRVLEHEWALAESQAVARQKAETQAQVADNLVRDVWSLSRQVGELKQIKEEHEKLLVQYDEVVAKLMHAEDDLAQRPHHGSSGEAAPAPTAPSPSTTTDTPAPAVSPALAPAPSPAPTPVPTPSTLAPTVAQIPPTTTTMETLKTPPPEVASSSTTTTSSNTNQQQPQQQSATIVQLPEPTVAIIPEAPETSAPPETKTEPPAEDTPPAEPAAEEEPRVAVVTLEEDDEPVPTLDNIDTKLLMQIFAYLDALDILNTAQINISMYSRVDNLFGLGGGNETSDHGDNSTIATVETTTAAPPAPQETPAPQPPPTPVSRPSQPYTAQPTTTALPPTLQPFGATSPAEGIRGLFSSMLQPARGRSPPRSSPMARPPVKTADHQSQPMNAAIASSMASKLSDAELNAIISMTERLRHKEAMVIKLTQERDDLSAKLDGTEGVKQFLINKVRDMEETLSAIEESEAKVAQQIESDQEVIAFLDGRVQELEQAAVEHEKQQEALSAELARVKRQADQKAVVMGDMLQFEREKWTENEREWKATKRLLVKEVKNGRKQIIALQADREGCRQENHLLRKAVTQSTASF